jgi:hypothetical protein
MSGTIKTNFGRSITPGKESQAADVAPAPAARRLRRLLTGRLRSEAGRTSTPAERRPP